MLSNVLSVQLYLNCWRLWHFPRTDFKWLMWVSVNFKMVIIVSHTYMCYEYVFVWNFCLCLRPIRVPEGIMFLVCHQLTARRALSLFNDVPLRTRSALSQWTMYSYSTLLVLDRTSLNIDSALLALNWRCDISILSLPQNAFILF